MNYSILLSKQNIFYKNHISSWRDDNYVYRQLYDVRISILFIELPLLLSYKFWNSGSSSFLGCIGPGYSISVKNDYKKSNYRNTDEILGTVIDIPVPLSEYYYDDSEFDHSGFNLNAGIQFRYEKLLLNFLYIKKQYQFKTIGKEYTLLLNLGYQLN